MVLFDTSVLLLLLDPTLPSPPDPEGKKVVEPGARVDFLVATLDKKREKIVIPTPVLAELLILAEETGPAYLHKLSRASVFKIESFDPMAAVELAAMTATAKKAGDKRAGSTATMAKIKFDRQIVAIAKAHGVDTIYTTDPNLAKFAKAAGITPVAVWDLPLPPTTAQPELPFMKRPEPTEEASAEP